MARCYPGLNELLHKNHRHAEQSSELEVKLAEVVAENDELHKTISDGFDGLMQKASSLVCTAPKPRFACG